MRNRKKLQAMNDTQADMLAQSSVLQDQVTQLSDEELAGAAGGRSGRPQPPGGLVKRIEYNNKAETCPDYRPDSTAQDEFKRCSRCLYCMAWHGDMIAADTKVECRRT